MLFEGICKEYLIRQAKKRNLPFIPYHIGKWWGTNSFIKAKDDVDVLALDKSQAKAIFVECKFTSNPMPLEEYQDLVNATKAFPKVKVEIFIFHFKVRIYTTCYPTSGSRPCQTFKH